MVRSKGQDISQTELSGEDENYSSSVSTGDIAKDLNLRLFKAGYKLLPATHGKLLAGHQPYKLTPLESNPTVKSWKRLVSELDFTSFSNNFTECIRAIMEDPDKRDVAIKVSSAVLEQPKSKQTAFYNYGQAKADYMTDTGSRSFLGAEGVQTHKQIPRVSWFPKLADLDPMDLLSLFPKPEARLMMLLLGRTVLGVGGTVTQEGTIEHKMRSAAIVVGKKAGLGKSTLLGYITAALIDLGYSTMPIANPNSRFGWGELASSDLAYRDDLTNKGQAALLASDVMKTIITGGKFATEGKGRDGVETDSKATVMAFTNVYVKEHFYGMDEGSLDRFNFLHTYNDLELARTYPNHDGRTEYQYQRLASKYDVSINQLSTYLLARSADYLLSTIGMELTDGQLLRVRPCALEATMDDLQQQLHYKPFVSHTKTLVHNIANLCSLAVAKMSRDDDEATEKMLTFFESYDFSIDLLIEVLEYFSESSTNEIYDLQNISSQCKNPIKRHEIRSLTDHRNLKDAFKQLTAEMTTKDGYSYPATLGIYGEIWQKERANIRKTYESFQRTKWNTPKELTTALSNITAMAT